ncbi:hypothetical protein F1880_008160 [Penicillium rolfsii]|nr:hypothetical protein F1880_008160 [Penicillium rolfsii]
MTVDIRSNHEPAVPTEWRQTPKDASIEQLRKTLTESGYVQVKSLLPKDYVQILCEEYVSSLGLGGVYARANLIAIRYFEVYEPTGIFRPGSALEHGISNDSNDPLEHGGIGAGELPPITEQGRAMIDVHTQPKYLQLRRIQEWRTEIQLMPTMIRHNAPHTLSTGIHYDQMSLRKGEADIPTALVPIRDIRADGGGLVDLGNSVRAGSEIEADFTRRAKDLAEAVRLSVFNGHREKLRAICLIRRDSSDN